MEVLGIFAAVFCGVIYPVTAAIKERRDPVRRTGFIICGALIGAFLLVQAALMGQQLGTEWADAAYCASCAEARSQRR